MTSYRMPRPLPSRRPALSALPASVYRLVFYTSLITGLQGIIRTLSVLLLLGVDLDPVVLGLSCALPTFIYGRDRLVDASPVTLSNSNASPRQRWVAAHRRPLNYLIVLAGITSILLMTLRSATFMLLLIGVTISLTYTIHWLPGKKSLKQLPGIKTPFVAAIWVTLVVWMPMEAAGRSWDQRTAMVAMAIFLMMCTIAAINDIYDIGDDRRNGTYSLAVMMGEQWTRMFACLLSSGAGVVATLSLHSAGLATAAFYLAFYAGYARSSRGRSTDQRF